MNKKTVLLLVVTLIMKASIQAQSVLHPWHVIDQGGGKSTAGTVSLLGSIGQPAIQAMSSSGTNLESGYIPALQTFGESGATFATGVSGGWDLISVPVVPVDSLKTVLYPAAVSEAFSYNGGYNVANTLQNGIGYWLKFASDTSVGLTGATIQQESVAVLANWNMIGTPSVPIPVANIVPLGTAIASSYFGYSTMTGYTTEDTLQPGAGYWVRVSQAGTLVLNSGLASSRAGHSVLAATSGGVPTDNIVHGVQNLNGIEGITITDARGRKQRLWFSFARPDIDPAKFELPPRPPEGVMDVRYGSNRMLEIADRILPKKVPILVSSAEYPLTIAWKRGDVASLTAELVVDGKMVALKGSGEVRVPSPASRLQIGLGSVGTAIPTTFALHQNYPNPFNPVTRITYDLPKDAHITLSIYDILGNKISTLKDEMENAGYKSVEWSSRDAAGKMVTSGVYFYRIQVTETAPPFSTFTQLRKMMVLK